MDYERPSLFSILFVSGLYMLGIYMGRRQVIKEIEEIAKEEEINQLKKDVKNIKKSKPYSSYFYT